MCRMGNLTYITHSCPRKSKESRCQNSVRQLRLLRGLTSNVGRLSGLRLVLEPVGSSVRLTDDVFPPGVAFAA